jgi:hypothetical protein
MIVSLLIALQFGAEDLAAVTKGSGTQMCVLERADFQPTRSALRNLLSLSELVLQRLSVGASH